MLENMQLKAHATVTPAKEGAKPTCDDNACKVDITPEVKAEMKKKAEEMFAKPSDIAEQTSAEAVIEPVVKRDSWPDQSTDDPKVTLAMIVRNEEVHLAECLASMKDHVDEIVVVDTGSTDRTIEIAKVIWG